MVALKLKTVCFTFACSIISRSAHESCHKAALPHEEIPFVKSRSQSLKFSLLRAFWKACGIKPPCCFCANVLCHALELGQIWWVDDVMNVSKQSKGYKDGIPKIKLFQPETNELASKYRNQLKQTQMTQCQWEEPIHPVKSNSPFDDKNCPSAPLSLP